MIKTKIISMIPNQNREFLLHAKNYTSAILITKGLGFLLIPIMTRLLVPSEYGILSVFGSIVSVSLVIMGLGFPGAVNRYYHENTNDFKEYIGTNVIFLLNVGVIWFIVLFVFRAILSKILNFDENLLLLASIVAIMGVFYQVYLYYLNAKKNSLLYAKIQIIKGTAIPITSIIWILLLSKNRYMGAIYSNLVISAFIFILSLYLLLKNSKIEFKLKYIWYSLKFGIPWIPHAISGFILAYFDRIIINQLNGPKEAGLYSFAYNIGMIIYIIVIGFLKSWNPIFYEKMNQKKYKEINSLAINTSKLIFTFAIILILFSKEIVMIMARSLYYEALIIVPVIVMSYSIVFLYSIFVGFSFYSKRTYLISINTFIAGTLNIVLNYIFIPRYGYKVASITTLFSYIVLFLLHYITVRYILKIDIIKVKDILKNGIGVLVYGLIFYVVLIEIDNIIMGILIKLLLLSPYLFYLYKRRKNDIKKDSV